MKDVISQQGNKRQKYNEKLLYQKRQDGQSQEEGNTQCCHISREEKLGAGSLIGFSNNTAPWERVAT